MWKWSTGAATPASDKGDGSDVLCVCVCATGNAGGWASLPVVGGSIGVCSENCDDDGSEDWTRGRLALVMVCMDACLFLH